MPTHLLEQHEVETSLHSARAYRVLHASRDLHGRPTSSRGLVIVPDGGGQDRPILTWAHGTTGLGDAACPSAIPGAAGPLVTYFTPESTEPIDYGIPGVQGFLDDGWIVCATDYQGLGTPGVHHYTVNRSNARDAVAIAHAAREMDVDAGAALGCLGWSQGGGAAAAVAELDDDDFGDLRLVGTVPMSPGVPAVAVHMPTGMGSALTDAHVAPDGHLIMLVVGLGAAFPELDLADVLTPLGREIVASAWNSQPVHHLSDTIARLYRLRGPILALDRSRLDAWSQALVASSAGQVRPRCPVLVCIDGFDGGAVIPVPWQTGYVDAVTALGGDVTTRTYPDDDHFSLPDACVEDARAWLTGLLP